MWNKKTLPKLIILAAASFTVGACQQKWEKPGATDAHFASSYSRCEANAHSLFPPMLQESQVAAGYTTPLKTVCTEVNKTTTCETKGGDVVPPRYSTTDRNSGPRTRALEACLMEDGWRKVKQN